MIVVLISEKSMRKRRGGEQGYQLSEGRKRGPARMYAVPILSMSWITHLGTCGMKILYKGNYRSRCI